MKEWKEITKLKIEELEDEKRKLKLLLLTGGPAVQIITLNKISQIDKEINKLKNGIK
jgi:hypothetical protein